MRVVSNTDHVMIMTAKGIMIRLPVSGISLIGRNTQGVKVINLNDGDRVIGVARVATDE